MSRFNWSEERRIHAACGSDTGLQRDINEDNLYFGGECMPYRNNGLADIATMVSGTDMDTPETDRFFAVFDGVGGADNGEIASYTAASTAYRFLRDSSNICRMDISPSLIDLCVYMNESVVKEARKLGSVQMGSTFAGLLFGDCYVWCCNLGDSRCYLFRNNELTQLSVDHVYECESDADGEETKPYITQFLGINDEDVAIIPSVSRHKVKEGDIYLICSDGLTDMVEEDRISEILAMDTTLSHMAKLLIGEALINGGSDNTTLIVCKLVME